LSDKNLIASCASQPYLYQPLSGPGTAVVPMCVCVCVCVNINF